MDAQTPIVADIKFRRFTTRQNGKTTTGIVARYVDLKGNTLGRSTEIDGEARP